MSMMNIALKKLFARWIWLVVACFLAVPSSSNAAENFSSSELDTLVATIALYPDPLLIQVLTASTYGDQIPKANQWAQEHLNLKGEDLAAEMESADLPFDPSVQALIPFPTVLSTMAKYRTWSDQLGDAVASQKDQVMDAIQRMRNRAYDLGQLQSNEQVQVTKDETVIIEPVRTEYVYVPVYNPRVVFYVHADGYSAIRYPHWAWLGSWYGEWGWGSCWFEWNHHHMFVRDHRWYYHRSIPRHPRRYNPPPRGVRPPPVRAGNTVTQPPRHENGYSVKKFIAPTKVVNEKVSSWKSSPSQQVSSPKTPGLHKNKVEPSTHPQEAPRYPVKEEPYYPESSQSSYSSTINASSFGSVKRVAPERNQDGSYESRNNASGAGNSGIKKSKRKSR